MALSNWQRMAHRRFGDKTAAAKGIDKLAENLRKAHMPVRAEAYLAACWLTGWATAAATLVLGILVAVAGVAVLDWHPVVLAVPFLLAPMAGFMVSTALAATPGANAKKRGRKVDRKVPYLANYMAAMSSAGVIPMEIFRSLSRQHIYGEASKEAAWVFKDMEVHGMDIVTALHRSTARTPSTKFQELLQGAITTITSGGDLTSYFRGRADRFQWENRVEQKTFIETMGIMAETYVTAAVAGPLFLIVMVAIIVLIGSGEMSQLQLIIYLLLPVINIGFVLGVKAMIPEA